MTRFIAIALFSTLVTTAHASHCKGRAQDTCTTDVACRWQAAVEAAWGKSPRKAHCRLDVKQAGILAEQAAKSK